MLVYYIYMKANIIKSIISVFLGVSLNGQAIINSTQENSGGFHFLVTLMESAQGSLYNDHYNPLEDTIIFTTDGFFSSEFQGLTEYNSFGFDIFFKLVDPNIKGFAIENSANIGFFGNESWDRNKLFLEQYSDQTFLTVTKSEKLYDYKRNAGNSKTPAPYTYDIENSGNSVGYISFSHTNQVKGNNILKSSERFKVYQAFDPFTQTDQTQWLFLIDDREDELVDYDDGFFYFAGDSSVTPVPEPALISAIGLFGLLSILYYKRKKQ